MIEWPKGCEICNAGLCARFDELIERGLGQRQAARELEKEQKEKLGEVIYPASSLRMRFRDNRPLSGRKSSTSTLETCAVSDLQMLIEAGKKFRNQPEAQW
jgi:hypothetical protein